MTSMKTSESVRFLQTEIPPHSARTHWLASTPSGIRPSSGATRMYSWVRGAQQHKVMSVRAAKSGGDSRSIIPTTCWIATSALMNMAMRSNHYWDSCHVLEYVTQPRVAITNRVLQKMGRSNGYGRDFSRTSTRAIRKLKALWSHGSNLWGPSTSASDRETLLY